MIIRSPQSIAIIKPTNKDHQDVQDILGIHETLIHFTETAKIGEWASIAEAASYDELHGLTNLVEGRHCRWVIFKCGEELYCLYVTPLTGAKVQGKQPGDYPQEVKDLSLLIAKGVLENGYSVTALAPMSLTWLRACQTVINKYSDEDIPGVLTWALEDEFWSTNIRSAAKFLKHFERLKEGSQRVARPKVNTSHARKDVVTDGLAQFFEQNQTEEDPF